MAIRGKRSHGLYSFCLETRLLRGVPISTSSMSTVYFQEEGLRGAQSRVR